MSKEEPAPQIVIVEDNVETNNLLRDWLKLRFAVDSTFAPSGGITPLVPQHAPHPGAVIVAPIARIFA